MVTVVVGTVTFVDGPGLILAGFGILFFGWVMGRPRMIETSVQTNREGRFRVGPSPSEASLRRTFRWLSLAVELIGVAFLIWGSISTTAAFLR